MPRKQTTLPPAEPAWEPRRLTWIGDGRDFVPGYPQADIEPRTEDEAAALLSTGLWAIPQPDEAPAPPADEVTATPTETPAS